jgi:hypothetical protein
MWSLLMDLEEVMLWWVLWIMRLRKSGTWYEMEEWTVQVGIVDLDGLGSIIVLLQDGELQWWEVEM